MTEKTLRWAIIQDGKLMRGHGGHVWTINQKYLAMKVRKPDEKVVMVEVVTRVIEQKRKTVKAGRKKR